VIPENDPQKNYASFIAKECILYGIFIHMQDGVEEWRVWLCNSVAMEQYIALLNKVRKWKREGVLKIPLVEYMWSCSFLVSCTWKTGNINYDIEEGIRVVVGSTSEKIH
jgi:hypothetical protein